ncbi:MAG: hypothetical protein NC328_05960 [Muribaculum sp.]|nr:hypothetical protein [Muribaculum sp.]
MTNKTYGAYGMIDWTVIFTIGRQSINVTFSGGKLSGFGSVPARFATSDPVLQNIIERSQYFKRGRIQIIHTEESEEIPRNTVVCGNSESGVAHRVIDVPDLNSARQQLMRMTGVAREKVMSRRDVEEVAKSNNIKLKISSY